MNTTYKQAVLSAIETEIERLGSAAKVATKIGLNGAYISMMRNPLQWSNGTVKDTHWSQAATVLGVRHTGWQTVDITNTRIVQQVLQDARDSSMFMAVSHFAGSGKTAACREYAEVCGAQGVYYYHVPHGETNKVDFLKSLAQTLGIDTRGQGYMSANRLADMIIEFFAKRLDQRPLLIVDEADKLTDKAKRFFISLYNAVEGCMGCVILGTENLEKQVKAGVVHSRNGFDEIDSRFGRRFIHLVGINKAEAGAICAANGITDKTLQGQLFEECEPVQTIIEGRNVKVIKDLRPLRRKIERELLKLADQATENNQEQPLESA